MLCILLIACSNVSGLMMARRLARQKELAIRAALGAGPVRLFLELASENLMLFGAGAAAGLLLAWWVTRVLVVFDLPRADSVGMNWTVVMFGLALCVVMAAGFGVPWPVGVPRARNALVIAQFALAVVLVTGSGLLVRSLWLLNAVNRGFDPSHLLTLQVPSGVSLEALERVRAVPGVTGVAIGSAEIGAFAGNAPNEWIVVEGGSSLLDFGRHARNIVSDEYFRVMGIPLRQGRWFSGEDAGVGPRVALINAAMSRRYWPGGNALGKRFKEVLQGMDAPWMTVIGVVGDVSLNRDGSIDPVFYASCRQWQLNDAQMVVRTAGNPRQVSNAVKDAVRSVNRNLPYFAVSSIEEKIREFDSPRRFQTGVTGLFAALALALAGLGLYGLMSYAVGRRRREIAIRMALGADAIKVRRLVVAQGMRLAVSGVAIGTGAGFMAARMLAAFVFGIGVRDPLVFVSAILVLLLVALAAVWIPARRATRVDPARALGCE